MRSDQYFENLQPLFEAIIENPNKFVCSNLHVRPDYLYKYHASDNIIATNTQDLLRTFEVAYERISKNAFVLLSGAYMYTDDTSILTPDLFNKYIDYNRTSNVFVTKYPDKPQIHSLQILPHYGVGVTPEQIVTTSYLLAKRILPVPQQSRDIMKKNIFIFKVESLGDHVNKLGGVDVLRSHVDEIHYINDI
jgi:hypothetical protein